MNFPIDYQKFFYLFKMIQLRDLIDIFLLSFLIFIIISIIIKIRSYKLIFGFFIILLLFFVANWANLVLTKNLLQFLLPFIILILAIIFQKEFRVFLEQLSIILPRRKILSDKEILINNILNAIKFLSKNKIGAIIAFENNIYLDPLIQEAKLLNAEISSELIISIFNKNSPLHDGAVIIKDNKIKYASAHLPLAENYSLNQNLGTRHRASIGLSESSDALVIVISEETGRISFAKNGKLFYNVNEENIINEIRNYYFKNSVNNLFISNYQRMIKNVGIGFLALFIAFSIWITTNYNKTKIQKIIEVPIEFVNLQDNLSVTNLNISKTKVLISGDEFDIKNLQIENIKAVVDLTNFEPSNYNIVINRGNLTNLPKSIEVLDINPDRLKFKIIEIKKGSQQTK